MPFSSQEIVHQQTRWAGFCILIFLSAAYIDLLQTDIGCFALTLSLALRRQSQIGSPHRG